VETRRALDEAMTCKERELMEAKRTTQKAEDTSAAVNEEVKWVKIMDRVDDAGGSKGAS